jgi:hypothetical protein
MSRTRRSPLGLVVLVFLSSVTGVAQLRAQPQSILGVVSDSAGVPIPGVEITLLRDSGSAIISRRTKSLADGAFSFDKVIAGTAYLRARHLGYKVSVTELRTDTLVALRPVRISMHSAAVEIAAVEIQSKSVAMIEFEERRRKRGVGHFVDRAEIERRRPAYASEILSYFPGNSTRQSSRGGNQSRVRGCKPSIWLDGVQAYGAELDEVVRVGDIDGMEIYSSWSGVPTQFSGRNDKSCGAILVWTRR